MLLHKKKGNVTQFYLSSYILNTLFSNYWLLDTFLLHRCWHTHSRSTGSPLTLLTCTFALQGALQKTREEEWDGPYRGIYNKICLEKHEAQDLPLHQPQPSVMEEAEQYQDVVTFFFFYIYTIQQSSSKLKVRQYSQYSGFKTHI